MLAKATVRLHAPGVFGLITAKHRAETLKFLADLRRLAEGNVVRKICIDFSRTKQMQPAGTILFLAEVVSIVECLDVRDRPVINCKLPMDKVAAQVLKHLGLLELLGSKAVVQVSADNVKHWKYESSNVVEGAMTASVLEEYRALFPHGPVRLLYEGLVEAMTNSRQHAYQRSRFARAAPTLLEAAAAKHRKWWMFSQHKDDHLSIVVCDLGMGIARSLLASPKWTVRKVLDVASASSPFFGGKDSRFIRAAMELGRSSTNRPNQGKGLHDMKEVIDSQGAGALRILSGRGEYLYSGANRREQLRDFPTSIFGTIVEWRIPLPSTGETT